MLPLLQWSQVRGSTRESNVLPYVKNILDGMAVCVCVGMQSFTHHHIFFCRNLNSCRLATSRSTGKSRWETLQRSWYAFAALLRWESDCVICWLC